MRRSEAFCPTNVPYISGQVAVGRDAVQGLALNVEEGMGDRPVKGR